MNLPIWLKRRAGAFVFSILISGSLLGGCANSHLDEEYKPLEGGGPQAAVPVAPSFKFVVIGDTRTGIDIFRQSIGEINLIDPDLVIDIGDLINGYTDDPKKIEAMWDAFMQTVKYFQVPCVMVPGNHDIFNLEADKIYRQRFGKTFFSFNYINVHFVVLNSETLDAKGKPIERISNEQVAWLRDDLDKNQDPPFTFVFLHKPLWAGGPESHWMKAVHPILAKYRVSAVFAGHVHEFRRCQPMDGIQYYITGGGGAELRADPERGGFHHYCLVTVRPKYWRLAVVKTGGVFSDASPTSQPAAMKIAPTSRPNKKRAK